MSAVARLLYPVSDWLPGPIRSKLLRRWNPKRKRYLLPDLSFEGFTERLNTRNISYVVLDGQPQKLEVLVADPHLDELQDLITRWPVGTPIKIYTPSARTGTAYISPLADYHSRNRIALFPGNLANGILDRAAVASDGVKVPSARDAFFARAYRAAYMEAACCEWTDSASACRRCQEYQRDLRQLAAAAEVILPKDLTPVTLDQLLSEHGWRPPGDLLEKAAEWAPWIRSNFPELQYGHVEQPGVAVFFIRELAIENDLKADIIETLKEKGFDPLLVLDLDDDQRDLVARALRGGNWGMGTWHVDGGRAACIVVGLDLLPLPVPPQVARHQPSCDDWKIIRAKIAARDLINADLPRKKQYNGLHSTDHSAQAWRVVRLLVPDQEEALRAQIEELRQEFSTRAEGVVRDFTRYGSRAQVALIEHQGRLAIRKTYRPSALRYMEREADVIETLAPICPEIPKLLARGKGYLVTEYAGESKPLPRWPRPLPLATVRQLARFIKTCVAHGYDPVDMRPSCNVMLTDSGLKVIDYEFWRRCDPATPPHKCYCLSGLPKDYKGDRPRGVSFLFDPYPTQWLRHTALSVESFLYDPAWLQALKRSAHLTGRYSRWLINALLRRFVVRPLRGVKRALQT